MSSMRPLRTQSGNQIALGAELGKGGEGRVYRVQGDNRIAAKIYHPDKAKDRREKIEAIVTAQWHKIACVAFPIDALFGVGSQFVGFTMPLVVSNKPIHDLYSPTSRKTSFPTANFPFLIRTSLNIASALANVHKTGCVIGDINHSGILISDKAIATLIDCDSFQVTLGTKTFLCKVGVPEFTPPELQKKRLDQVIRTQNHDAFSLAVVLFNLLFMGRHPFAGRFLGRGDMPLDLAIAQYRFAYSVRRNETLMEPPPSVPLLSDIPPEMSNAFEVAFGQIGVTKRPTAAEWVNLLRRAESEVVKCKNSPNHQYFRAASSCPWCRMEAAYPGFVAFVPTIPLSSVVPINLGQLIGAIRGVQNPGTVSDLSVTMPTFLGNTSPTAVAAKRNWTREYFYAIAVAFVGSILFRVPWPGPAAALLMLGTGVAAALRQPKEMQAVQKLIGQAKASWSALEGKWNQSRDIGKFLERRREADELVRQVQNLGGEEAAQLAELKVKQREAQLTVFLQRFYIDHAKIKGIGNSRKVVLRSWR